MSATRVLVEREVARRRDREVGWWCSCGVFNGALKEPLGECRVCRCPRVPRLMVDELKVWATTIRCFKGGSCHLTTEGELLELHGFARQLGLRHEWFQETPGRPDLAHYDLTPGRRVKALALGAVFVPARTQAINRRRIAGAVPKLDSKG